MFNIFEGYKRIKKALGSAEENLRKGDSAKPTTPNFVSGLIYEAKVTEVLQPNNGVVCLGESAGTTGLIPGMCIWAAGIMSDLFGFKMNYVPPAGSRVLVLVGSGNVNYIVGGYLTELHGDYQGQQKSALGSDEEKTGDSKAYADSQMFTEARKRHQLNQTQEHNIGGHPSWDVTEGELEITNALGVGATFLRHIAQLKGSDLAKVECMLIDDMVRIISQTYKHFSAFGDFKIYNDGGKLNVQWDGTSSDWEISGKSELDDRGADARKIEETEDEEKQNMLKMSEQNTAKDAKWRFSHFVGFLGDFINTFVTDPTVWEASGDFLEQAQRSGKFRLHVNEDGTGIISTVNEFIIEKTPRIAVPLELKREYDPDGNDPEKDLLSDASLDFLKTWNFEESGGVNNIHYSIYQIRDYAKWLSNKYSKAQFLRLSKDWRVPTEADVPVPDILGQKKGDKSKANADTNYSEGIVNAYATIKIAKDGSVVLLDAYDNAVTLTKMGIQLSSHNNVQIESAGSINMVAGRDINLVAKNSVDVTATKGGYSLRAETFMQNYCNKGGILFETNQSYDSPIYEAEDMPFADQLDDSRIKGILLKTNGSSDVRLESNKSVGIKANQDVLITARGTCGISASRAQINDTIEIFPKGSVFTDNKNEGLVAEPGDKEASLGLIKVEGWLLSEKILANYLVQYAEDLRPMLCPDEDEDGHLIGADRVIANQADVDAGDADNVGDWIGNEEALACHPWHVLTQNKEKWETTIESTTATLYKNHISMAKFVHRNKTEYGTVGSGIGEGTAGIYQTLTQQALINDTQNTLLNKVEYADDLWPIYVPLGDRGAAWPGTEHHLMYPTTKKLWMPDDIEPSAYMNKAEKLIKQPYIMKTIK